ncbi:MAG: cell division protein FtsZ [Spirochaetales bacterium]|nr:cell division protein FtsZ [Spirochaetales bacterium]
MNLEVIESDNFVGSPTIIKVIGVGGGGSNAVNRMIKSGLDNVEFYAVNTDVQALNSSVAANKIAIGSKRTKGLGAGGNPVVGEEAAQEDEEKIRSIVEGADMIFIAAGMGGGTGTGAAPVIAKIAKDSGALTVGVVTKPFNFERPKKKELAEQGIVKLRDAVDTLITIPNQNLMKLNSKNLSIVDAFSLADDVLLKGVKGISDLITHPGYINIDFADVRTVMNGRGDALMGIGHGTGDNMAVDAATNAINNPLLDDVKIEGAKGILVNVSGGPDLSLTAYEEIINIITANADSGAIVIPGLVTNENMQNEVSVTVVATGFYSEEETVVATDSVREDLDDVVDIKEWDKLGRPLTNNEESEYVRPSDFNLKDDIAIPSFLRMHGKRVDD